MGDTKKLTEKEKFLYFRYNLYMMEYMYDCIVKNISNDDNNKAKLLESKKRTYMPIIVKTPYSHYSKYRHGTTKKPGVTKETLLMFNGYPNLEGIVTGETLIVDLSLNDKKKRKKEEIYVDEEIKVFDEAKKSIESVAKNVVEKDKDLKITEETIKAENKLLFSFAMWLYFSIENIYKNDIAEDKNIEEKIVEILKSCNNYLSQRNLDDMNIGKLEAIHRYMENIWERVDTTYNYRYLKKHGVTKKMKNSNDAYTNSKQGMQKMKKSK